MKENYLNAKYSFELGGMSFTVEIDDTLSAEYRSKNYPAAIKKTLHFHPLHELFFVFDEEIKITLESNTSEYKNCIVSLPPNMKHFTYRSFDYRLLFSCTEKEKTKNAFSSFYNNILNSDTVCCIPSIKPNMKVYLDELCDLFYNQRNTLSKEILTSLLKLIFYNLYLHSTPFAQNSDYSEESRYIIMSRIISSCTTPGNDVTVSKIADALHLSEKQASRMIHKYFDCSLTEVITNEKLDYSCYLLTSTDIPIADVAYKSNFHSENYFFYLFKKKFGITPLKYRKRQAEP